MIPMCQRYGVNTKKPICIISTGLPRPGLARSAQRGQIYLLRGYVSKSSTALNPLMITQLARKRPRGRSRTALRGSAHQLAVRIIFGTRPDSVRYAVLCNWVLYSILAAEDGKERPTTYIERRLHLRAFSAFRIRTILDYGEYPLW